MGAASVLEEQIGNAVMHLVNVKGIHKVEEVDAVDMLTEYIPERELTSEHVDMWMKHLENNPDVEIVRAKISEIDNSKLRVSDAVKMMMRQVGQYPLLDLPDERRYGALAAGGDKEARDILIKHNMRLVISIAKKYRNRGLDFEDLIQHGNEGLLKAVDKYDPQRTSKLSTMAVWWIRQSIVRSLAKYSNTIYVPDYMFHTVNRVGRAEVEFLKEHGRQPTESELAEVANTTEENVRTSKRIINERPCSLETPVGDDGGTTVGDFVSDSQKQTSVFDNVSAMMAKKDLMEIMEETLNEREITILRMRFGFDGDVVHTLEQVGNHFGITRERARQIEMKAFRKLRSPEISERLSSYIQ